MQPNTIEYSSIDKIDEELKKLNCVYVVTDVCNREDFHNKTNNVMYSVKRIPMGYGKVQYRVRGSKVWKKEYSICKKCDGDHYIIYGCCSGRDCGCMGQPVGMTNCQECNPKGELPPEGSTKGYAPYIEYTERVEE